MDAPLPVPTAATAGASCAATLVAIGIPALGLAVVAAGVALGIAGSLGAVGSWRHSWSTCLPPTRGPSAAPRWC